MSNKIDKFQKDKKPSQIDRIEGYLIGDRSILSKRDEEMHKKLKFVIAFILKKNSKKSIIESMQTSEFWAGVSEPLSERQSYNIYNLATKLLPKLDTIDKEVERIVSIKKYNELGRKAEKVDDLKTALLCYAKADELMGLFDKKDSEGVEASLYFQNVQINVMRSSDPEVYFEKQRAVRERLINEEA